MRLWHQQLIHYLPNKQLIGQHRECCALRGNGWGKKHSVVNYVFKHPYSWLFYYHYLIMFEMRSRNFQHGSEWGVENYRGKVMQYIDPNDNFVHQDFSYEQPVCKDKFKWFWHSLKTDFSIMQNQMIYPEHDSKYLVDCLNNLKNKNVQLVNDMSISKMKMQAAIEYGI